jgi:cellulose synthase/poly-beta-1,6-N-acetylglucosamine synthase-like glycosyltransferase
MRVFFIVLARDRSGVDKKARELDGLGFPYLIVCGDKVNHPNVVHREPLGKYDAINFGSNHLPEDAEIVGLNDVDTEIHGLEAALRLFKEENVSLVFVRVDVNSGPQVLFYSFLDALRARIPIAASGELMLIRREVFKNILPLEACKSEDSYVLFKILERGHKAAFCRECYVTTKRTANARQEEDYKRRTVGGIYQALAKTKPPAMVKLFYGVLPFLSPVLLVSGRKGYYWAKGIILGFADYLRGDRATSWKPSYA